MIKCRHTQVFALAANKNTCGLDYSNRASLDGPWNNGTTKGYHPPQSIFLLILLQ